ncbi:hypothetical protein ACIQXF_13515 [Lysinibacillus sp. NPDC097231]|uniref:hypothetical protein n=1 Tax=Lysinibacillus sp. NPDC097231 TaxID=3364142 RepID=UPI00380CCFFC
MDLHNRLKKLNNLPEDQAVKSRIYEHIQHKKKKGFSTWKEGILLLTIAVIALFLILLPQNSSLPQTANHSIQAIYKYFGGQEGKFFARSSGLYISVEKVDDTTVYSFFQDLTQYVEEANGKLGKYIVDVVVVRNQQEEHYQVSDTGMLNVDSGQFFVGKSAIYDEIFFSLYDVKARSWLFFLPVIIITVVNLISIYYYSGRKLEEKKPSKRSWQILLLAITVLVGIIVWATWVGPLYRPLMVVIALLYHVIVWHYLKRDIQKYSDYKVEMIKISIFCLAVVFMIIMF